jgi:hypothetical protein
MCICIGMCAYLSVKQSKHNRESSSPKCYLYIHTYMDTHTHACTYTHTHTHRQTLRHIGTNCLQERSDSARSLGSCAWNGTHTHTHTHTHTQRHTYLQERSDSARSLSSCAWHRQKAAIFVVDLEQARLLRYVCMYVCMYVYS